jgi:hypothetical protein
MLNLKTAAYFSLLMIIFALSTCKSSKEYRQTIYENNFDTGNTENLSNTKISSLNQIPPHELLEITFDQAFSLW